MQIAKNDVEQLLKNLPDESSYEDIQYHLYVLVKTTRTRSGCFARTT